MPYSIETNHPDCEGFAVTKDDDGTLMGCHVSQDAANDQIAALYAAEADEETYSREVTLVWGPPCSGKSSFVRQNARRGDHPRSRFDTHGAQ